MADISKIGMEFPPYTIKVEKNKIVEFTAALAQKEDIRDIKSLYQHEQTALDAGYPGIPMPPTFAICFVFWTGGGLMGIIRELGVDVAKLLHSEEEYEYLAPICAGDTITRKMKVADIYERGKKERAGRYFIVTVLETQLINQRNEVVLNAKTTFIER